VPSRPSASARPACDQHRMWRGEGEVNVGTGSGPHFAGGRVGPYFGAGAGSGNWRCAYEYENVSSSTFWTCQSLINWGWRSTFRM